VSHVVAWVIGILIALPVLGIATVVIAMNNENRKSRLPPEPMTDISPFIVSLISGRDVAAYTAKVTAVTPTGITVRQSRCCTSGHQSPKQAVAHADAIKRRIERTGR
jgi:hypothetical protein